ncbi:MOSC domain-containing protein [Clostridium sp. YIM B02551]|uniref:MOSC domain-containing protein n=1 Tax=Clostridium sp. YIM B02551 TaxID=2910679 RepID=UPI001EEB2BE3|nr:MOSC domain-containing protein [Clostridium sp. YIM B02551]
MGEVIALCISKEKGTAKDEIPIANFIEDYGIEGDAHAGKWHRQISLLSLERIEEFRQKGGKVKFGDFGENIVVKGIELTKLPIGTRLKCGDVILEMTQIGKECHSRCHIFYSVGDCIMPREGVFCRVIRGGVLTIGEKIGLLSEDERQRNLTNQG